VAARLVLVRPIGVPSDQRTWLPPMPVKPDGTYAVRDRTVADLGMSRPVEPAPSQRHRSSPAGVLSGQVLLVVALPIMTGGVVMSTSSAITIGAIVFLACWVSWLYGSGATRR
jgi:hypothetical protein